MTAAADSLAPYSAILAFIKQQKPDFSPKIGLVLGSGLGGIADQIDQAVSIPYHAIPGFPHSTVKGHQSKMILGMLKGVPVVCMQGRIHSYEGADANMFKIFIRTLKLLGCEILLVTNAAGSLRKETGPGELCLMTDHLNLQHSVPLVGPNDEAFGERFFAMDNAYDKLLSARLLLLAEKLEIVLAQGVYAAVTGPCFETPAEIRAFRVLGADLVGMSTVPEVIIARHCGLRVAGISAVTNFAAGMSDVPITHEETLHYGKIAAINLARLIESFTESFLYEPC